MNRDAVAACRWLDPGGLAAAERIGEFLEQVGIAIETGPVGDGVLAGMTVTGGRIVVDPAVPGYPGDLLHEAGHLAVCEPAARAGLAEMSDDPGEEMAAIAWSAAAARACGIGLEVLFHDHGYKDGAETLRTMFAEGDGVGVPLLAWYGMTAEPRRAAERGMAPFPAMTRWLR